MVNLESYIVYGLWRNIWLKILSKVFIILTKKSTIIYGSSNKEEDDARIGLIIETLDNDYDDVPALDKLDATLRCDRHVRNCALQNVFKIFNWWSNHHHEGSINPYLH